MNIHTFTCFGDDITMLQSTAVISELTKMTIEIELKAVNCFSGNKLKLNKDKTHNIIVTSKNELSNKDNVNLLGITTDDTLKWESHINVLCKKLSTQLFLLRQLKKVVCPQKHLTSYH